MERGTFKLSLQSRHVAYAAKIYLPRLSTVLTLLTWLTVSIILVYKFWNMKGDYHTPFIWRTTPKYDRLLKSFEGWPSMTHFLSLLKRVQSNNSCLRIARSRFFGQYRRFMAWRLSKMEVKVRNDFDNLLRNNKKWWMSQRNCIKPSAYFTRDTIESCHSIAMTQ